MRLTRRSKVAPSTIPGQRWIPLLREYSQHKLMDRMLGNVALRRTWSLHRHAHLVAAFEQAKASGPITTMLAAGCGAGLTELYLAAANPAVHVTLTDVDPVRLAKARDMGDAWGIGNVEYGSLDLLLPRRVPRFDFVASIEVLEHIEDDSLAARNLIDHANRFVYILVPFCSEEEWADEARRAHVWEHNDHHRPGYTHRTFAEIIDGATPRYVRNAYFMPEGSAFRARLETLSDDAVIDQRHALIAEAALDVQDRTVAGGTRAAQAIEALLEVDPRRP